VSRPHFLVFTTKGGTKKKKKAGRLKMEFLPLSPKKLGCKNGGESCQNRFQAGEILKKYAPI